MSTSDTAERIREAGLRATKPRIAVYDALRSIGGHRTTDEVAEAVEDLGAHFSRATIFNVLDDLTRVDLVMRADRGPGPAIYEAADTWHHHFVCRECGAVIDVPCVVGSKPCLDADIPGAIIDEAQIIFRGLCPTCAAPT